MVKSVSSLTRNGVRDYLLQRVSALYLALFLIGFIAYMAFHPVKNFAGWHGIFEHHVMKVATLLFLASLILHAWIGMWAVVTDYLKDSAVRMMVLVLIMAILLASFAWGMMILWG